MSVAPASLPELVTTRDSFEKLVQYLGGQRILAVDTESNSLHAYQERVCLIQFSTPDRDIVLDPLPFEDLGALAGIFEDASIQKVFHAAEYDLICLRRDYRFSFANIFDTMQAGRILGSRQAGLDRLLQEKFDLKMSKRFQKADWGVRPLSDELLQYAALDTHYLIPLRDILMVELQAKGLWELAQEDFRMACDPTEPKPREDLPAWTRLASRRDLSPRERAVARELVTWRDDTAERLDRPPFKVLDEERLVEIARAQPSSTVDLVALGLGSRQLEHWGTDILAAVQRGIDAPLVQPVRRQRPSAAYLKRLDKLKTWRKEAAAAMDVESDVVLPRALLLELAERGSKDLKSVLQVSPWRLQHFGEDIARVLELAG